MAPKRKRKSDSAAEISAWLQADQSVSNAEKLDWLASLTDQPTRKRKPKDDRPDWLEGTLEDAYHEKRKRHETYSARRYTLVFLLALLIVGLATVMMIVFNVIPVQ